MRNYLVEYVYEGELHEPFGIYYGENVKSVIESLQEEIDANGTVDYLSDESVKFISQRNLPSYWMIYRYEE